MRQKIRDGIYRPGERLRRQHDMARDYGVAFATLKQSLDILEREGYIVRRPGRGTYAALPMKTMRRALVVDKDVAMRRYYKQELNRVEWDAIAVATGAVALENLREGKFDAIFLDLSTQGVDGVHTFQEIRRIDPRARVVMVVTHSDLDLVRAAISVGTFVVMRKPFGLESIRIALGTLQPSAGAAVVGASMPMC